MVIVPAVPPIGVTAHVNVVSAVLTAAVSARVEVWVLVLYVPCATVYPESSDRSAAPVLDQTTAAAAVMSEMTQDRVTAVPLSCSLS